MSHPIEITDSHCHLDFDSFDEDRDEMIGRAVKAGVTRMVTICTKLRLEPQVRALAEQYEPVFYAAGTHPMSVADEPMATIDGLTALARHPK
ncbi:MAG: TatD family hydrolase, partial [Pseudomonadota bacterium]